MFEQQQAVIHELRNIRSQLQLLREQSRRTAADVTTAIDTARRALRERCPRVYAQWQQPAADRPESSRRT